jgi:hypothetical protein
MDLIQKKALILGLVAVLLAAGRVDGDTVIDDFESYSNGQVIGQSATSTPWRRFGRGTNDNIYAAGHEKWVITGSRSGLYGTVWPAPFAATRHVYREAKDLSGEQGIGVKIRSGKRDTHTLVRVAVSNGRTTYVTIAEKPLTGRVQQLRFEIDEHSMVRNDGSDSYHQVIQGVWTIGFDFRSTEGEYVETIVFDDFVFIDDTEDTVSVK